MLKVYQLTSLERWPCEKSVLTRLANEWEPILFDTQGRSAARYCCYRRYPSQCVEWSVAETCRSTKDFARCEDMAQSRPAVLSTEGWIHIAYTIFSSSGRAVHLRLGPLRYLLKNGENTARHQAE